MEPRGGSPWFEFITSALLIYGCACLALERRGMPSGQKRVVEVSNNVLNLVFTVELIVRVAAVSGRVYLRTALNKLDLVLVGVGLADAVISLVGIKVRL